jgi:hypothetical protein
MLSIETPDRLELATVWCQRRQRQRPLNAVAFDDAVVLALVDMILLLVLQEYLVQRDNSSVEEPFLPPRTRPSENSKSSMI